MQAYEYNYRYAGTKPTRTSFLLSIVKVNASTYSVCESRFSNPWNSCKILTTTYAIWVSTICCTGHILFPPRNGMYSHMGFNPSQRSGRKEPASGPQMDGSRCMARKLVSIWVPGWTRMGRVPVGPPPLGRTVVRRQVRRVRLAGRTRRSASKALAYSVR